jgi:zinc protease
MRRGCAAVLALWLCVAVRPAAAIDIQAVTSPKGITAWLVRDATVPVISLKFAFRAGSLDDPPGREGRAAMAAMLLTEGAGDLDSEAFHRRLEDIAATIGFSTARNYFRGSMRTLSKSRDQAFRLLALAVRQSRFDDAAVARIRARVRSIAEDDGENPRSAAGVALFEAIFAGHPYARPLHGTAAGIDAVTVADLRDFQRRLLARDNLMIGVVGDITRDELARRLDQVFGDLPATSARRGIARTKPVAAGRVIVVQRDIPQSFALLAGAGIGRGDPDWYAAYLVNRILGGGPSSRLAEAVRERRGLAYSVYSYLDPMDYAPLILGSVATANARIAESLRLIRAEWRRMAQDGPTEAELAAMKTYVNGSFPLQFDASGNVADMLVGIQISGLGIDYVGRRPRLFDAVTIEDARRVARRLFDTDKLTVVIVGKPQGITPTTP